MNAPTMLPADIEVGYLTPGTGITIQSPQITKIGKMCFINTVMTMSSQTLDSNKILATYPDGFAPDVADDTHSIPTAILNTSGGQFGADFRKTKITMYTGSTAITWINFVGYYLVP